jgi:very-short-patch-repair endonuclease
MKSNFEMYYGTTMETLDLAKKLRKSETRAEKPLWEKLNSKRFYGLKFRRQHPISQYIFDFHCHSLKLVIEVGGGVYTIPENKERDNSRTDELKRFDLKVLRFTNDEIENEMDMVLNRINKALSPPDRGI